MNILVLNTGSSSAKYQLIDMRDETVLAKGLIERIGLNDGVLTHKPIGKDDYKITRDIPNHEVAINLMLEALLHPEHGVIKDKSEIEAVGHRVVHGGEKFSGTVTINQEVIDMMEECVDLAPLHNPANLRGIYAMQKLMPDVLQCGVFDTAFHHTIPEHAYLYGLPYSFYEKYKIRRYGFHGTSHKFVSQKACDWLGVDISKVNIITCHLGNGSSIAAIRGGKSIDTSMGLTPVEGLIMGTRCGDIDLGAIMYLMAKEDLGCDDINSLINKQSGMLGISGVSSDMRDIEKAAEEGNERAQLALDMFAYRVKKYIGSYAAALGRVDMIIFTGGIGENDLATRERVCSDLGFLGIVFDKEKNKVRGKDAIISSDTSITKVMVITTNEELLIARETLRLAND
jgi:acetate kinase